MASTAWSNLSAPRKRQCALLLSRYEFASYGWNIGTADTDGIVFTRLGQVPYHQKNRCVDYTVEKDDKLYNIKVCSIDATNANNYATIPASNLRPSNNTYVCYVRYVDGYPPEVYLIPSTEFKAGADVFEYKDNADNDADAEYIIKHNNSTDAIVREYLFDKVIAGL